MKGLKETLAELARLRKRFEGLVSSAAKRGGSVPVAAAPLSEVTGFGRNPGNLRMLVHVPRNLRKAPALVVALHGCTQTAAAYDYGSGWSSLADALGFAVLFPEQQRANNPNNCFNWFLPSDSRRGHGETESIREMIERMIENHGIDRIRVFIVGLSAGGAMAAAMLANYPEIFAGGAIIAGLPYGAATNVQTAFEAMARGRERSGQEWGGLVRSASSHQGRWPKISIWHGTADAIVSSANLEQSVSQWRNVHGVDARPQSEQMLEGHSRRVWRKAGRDVIEAITVDGMAHGVPLATSGPMRSGHAGAFHFDVGISSSHRILEFWQLADRSQAFADKVNAPAREQSQVPISAPAIEPPLIAARETGPGVKSGHSDDSRVGKERRAEAASFPDPREVITAALMSAGLLKSEAPEGRGTSRSLDPTGIVASTLRSVGLLKE